MERHRKKQLKGERNMKEREREREREEREREKEIMEKKE